MILSVQNDLLVSYAIHINSFLDFELIKYTLLLISKKCKMIGITYSINSNINENKIKAIFLLLKKDIKNLIIYDKIKNEGYDFKKHVNTIKNFQEKKLHADYILLMNDSVIPTTAISFNKMMFNLELFMNKRYEFIGLLSSNEIKQHYQSWFWCCNKNIINWLIMQIENIIIL